tara:strand:+ start:786 stop:1118 length:333 start_codon:yes stop_codon:yes gene_type:complete
MTFQKQVVSISMIILVAMFIFIAYVFHKGQSEVKFPPVIPKCPDYWTVGSDGKTCINTLGLGSCTSDSIITIDDPQKDWHGSSGLKNKCEWAKSCKLTWDGITNNNKINC